MNKYEGKGPSLQWLTIAETKDILFTVDKKNVIRYKLRRFGGQGVLDADQIFFCEVVFTAKQFQLIDKHYPHWSCRVALIQWDNDAKMWILDPEIIQLTLTEVDYKWFLKAKIMTGDRLSVQGRVYVNKHKEKTMRNYIWDVLKRSENYRP